MPSKRAQPVPTKKSKRPARAGAAGDDAATPVGIATHRVGTQLTTAQGLRVDDTDHSLRTGSGRGPTLLEDHHLREKITHFDHERIPERVVHARGAAAHGRFRVYNSLGRITSAQFLNDPGIETPVFVRFSTVAGSRGSADTVRDARGFAVKFYTAEGNYDLVGNNIPVFFIQDGIKFPDFVHAVKPEPDREIPQAASAHDTFWDFVSLRPESTHMLMWVMSDRAIPRSLRTMEGFGVHTFRLVAADGSTSLVKFHWKPKLGVHGLVWEEAQKLCGVDADAHRRDLWNAIAGGAFPEWELGLQVMPDTPDQMFEGIDLLDPTKLVPEELCPVQLVGSMVLDRNPTNYFAETEQVAFHPGHLVPGIDLTDDPLLHARLFSYLDTQISRLGGPNFGQLPVNRPHVPVDDNQRDGMHQSMVHEGVAAYAPNSLGGGCPFASPEGPGVFVHQPRPVDGRKARVQPVSFDDHFTQATLFWNSLSPVEQEHVVGAFTFELSKVQSDEVVVRTLSNLGQVAVGLHAQVAQNLGRSAPVGRAPVRIAHAPDGPSSAALSMLTTQPGPVDGRQVAILVAESADLRGCEAVRRAIELAGAVAVQIPLTGGAMNLLPTTGPETRVPFISAQSVQFDAIVIPDAEYGEDAGLALFVQEAYRHSKTVAAWGPGGVAFIAAIGVPATAPGVVIAENAVAIATSLVPALGMHRHWGR